MIGYFKEKLIFSFIGIVVFGALFVRGQWIIPYVILVILFYVGFLIYIKKYSGRR
jgi:hypothetical protein